VVGGVAMIPDPAERVRHVADAIEALIKARIAYELAIRRLVPLAESHKIDVEETREHLRDKLGELLK
jgi:hypothetical protein